MLIDRLRTGYRRELREVVQHTRPGKSNLDLLEVFCYADSQLTTQGRRLGMRAERFGLEQGDLMTAEGRKQLFALVARDKPSHLWFSLECKAWSAWSRLNAQRSLQSWDKFVQERLRHQKKNVVQKCLVLAHRATQITFQDGCKFEGAGGQLDVQEYNNYGAVRTNVRWQIRLMKPQLSRCMV